MSVSYSFQLAVGYRVTEEMIRKRFGVVIPERFHMEPRFDHLTGKPLAPAKVVDEDGENLLELNGKRYDYMAEEFIEDLCAELKCVYTQDGSGMSDEVDYILGPKVPRSPNEDDADLGNIDCGAGADFHDLAALEPDLGLLRDKLNELGLDVQPPVVTIACYIC